MASLMLAGFVGTFNETALNIALSNFIQVFSISTSIAQWLTTGYLLTLGILIPLSGLLMQWFTTRQLFLTAAIVSLAGAGIGGMAGSFEVLLTGRILQATGTGLLLPLMFNMVFIIFPAHKRGMAMGLVTMIFTAAPAVGPTVSGLLIANLSWHWIFWLSFVLMLIALLVGSLYMQNVSTITKPRIDLFSLAVSTVGFGGIVFGFSHAGEGDAGWNNAMVVWPLIVGGVALILFVFRQLTMERPLMNVKAFKHPMFLVGTLLIFVCMSINISSMLLLPMFLIRVLEMSTLSAAIILLPGGIVMGLSSPLIGRLFDKFGPRFLVIPGLVLAAVALWFFTDITAISTTAFIVTLHVCLMIGIALVWMPAQTNGMNQLPREMHRDGTAIMNSLIQVAGAIGMAVSVSIMTAGGNKYMKAASMATESPITREALAAGIQDALLFVLSVAVAGAIVGLMIKRVKVSR
ncbi:DHA2 family efflux MFS transporter permease subunit [Paenibacillus sp. WQ 127069]|uniref:DHA2 family efflux MFS transporter permease subunit n=1 Tax=Paenibacillus baimaensis TaxID=2982185 RepID=A0ABT2UFE2_9BACL|nr:DHA2 family efflux MFS transporter permease subunit [Paenibacillus sp. WQ 127069]MCU6792746.1 DHA2 family efflux MFS transporter permease subunit [Paenibacillus sp. WQ 127069]